MRRGWPAVIGWMVAMPALAETAGPAQPPAARTSPAEQAIAYWHRQQAPAPLPKPCRPGTGDEITVCANPGDRSPDRIPLPAESGPRAGPRTAIGEMPHIGIGGSPALQGIGAGVTLTIPLGKGTAPAPVKVTGNGEQ